MNSKFHRFGYLLGPSVAGLVLALMVAVALGGPVAGAIAGFIFGSSFVVSAAISLALAQVTSTGSPVHLVLLGIGSYLASIVLVLVLWSMFGPSQIM